MKRLISTLLCVCMLMSAVSGFGFTFAMAETPSVADDYKPLFDSASDVYANTMVVIPSLDTTSGNVTYTFGGVSVTESYDASRHFPSFSDAYAAWESRFDDSLVVVTVPNFILTAGTYDETITVRYNANIYGAPAGIAPNDASYDIDTALPASEWALVRTDDSAETIIAGGIVRSNVDGTTSDDNIKYETLMQQANAESFNLSIDGVKFTSATAIGTMSEKYNVSGVKSYRTNIIDVKNSIFSGNKFGISAENDASRNINEYTVTDCHITGITGAFVYKNPKKIHFDRVNYTLSEHIYNSSGMLWTNTGGDRNVDFTFENSRFSSNTANQLLQLYDNVYLPSFVVTFENNIMYNAWEKTYGGIYYKTFVDSEGLGRYNGPDFVFRGNTIVNTNGKYISVLNGNKTEQLASYDIEFTQNRIIGYHSVLPNTDAVMDSFLPECNWSVENNYFADTFTSVDDVKGTAPKYYAASASYDPANIDDAVYYIDYKMTLKSTDFLTGTTKEYTYFNINQADRVVRAIVGSEAITDFGFTSGGDVKMTYTLYSDEALTNAATTVDPSTFANGSAAQLYKNYKTDTLANAGLSEQQKNVEKYTLTDVTDTEYALIDDAAASWKSAGLYLENTINIRLSFTTSVTDNLSVIVTDENLNVISQITEIYKTPYGRYYVYCDELTATIRFATVLSPMPKICTILRILLLQTFLMLWSPTAELQKDTQNKFYLL